MFPWNQFEDFNKYFQQFSKFNHDPAYIENFVQEMISKSVPSSMNDLFKNQDFIKGFLPDNSQTLSNGHTDQQTNQQQHPGNHSLDAEVFETHGDVFLRIPLKDKAKLKNIKAYHTMNQFHIEGYPGRTDKHVLQLPAIVRKKGVKAHYHNGVLEFRLPKNDEIPISEIDVRHL